MSETMKAMTLREFGPAADVFEEREVPRPVASAGQVLVKVEASSVNPVDCKIRSGMLEAVAPPAPVILGCDLAGTVVGVGEGVTRISEGDEVFGCGGGVKGLPGALAEYVACDSRFLSKRPQSLPLSDCAALPLVTITAWDGLIDRADIQPGSSVLVHGGTGGVGHVATQLAKMRGAKVYVTGSSREKLETACELGADVGINYTKETVAEYVAEHTGGAGFDFVYDTVGGENVEKCFEAAALEGHVISISTRCNADLSALHAKALTLHVTFMLIQMLFDRGREHHGEIMRRTATAVDSGRLRPLIHEKRFAFSEIAMAHELLEGNGAVGKIVVENRW